MSDILWGVAGSRVDSAYMAVFSKQRSLEAYGAAGLQFMIMQGCKK